MLIVENKSFCVGKKETFGVNFKQFWRTFLAFLSSRQVSKRHQSFLASRVDCVFIPQLLDKWMISLFAYRMKQEENNKVITAVVLLLCCQPQCL